MKCAHRSGFSLLELLIVIGIVVLLLAILLPVVSNVRKMSRSTACLANLQQWGYSFQMYVSSNHGNTIAEQEDAAHLFWWEVLAPYNSNVRAALLCPDAREQRAGSAVPDPARGFLFTSGSANAAWRAADFRKRPRSPPRMASNDYLGGYGMNAWINHHPYPNMKNLYIQFPSKDPARIPLLGDNKAPYAYPSDGDGVPKSLEDSDVGPGIASYCMDRHQLAINVVFLDGHAEHVRLGDLWKLHWTQSFVPREVTVQGQ